MLKTFTLVGLLILGVTTKACPPGPGQTELTFSQVMINFGKFLRKADQLSLKGLSFPDSVSLEELEEAKNEIGISLSCAETSFGENPLGPARLGRMSPEEAQDYIVRLQSFMRTFKILLENYERNFEDLLGDRGIKNFERAYETSKKIQEWASTAHAYL